MAWEQIKARDYSDAPVTVAWVKCGGGNSDFRLRVGVPSGVCSRMGLKARDRCNVFRDKVTGKLRLVLTKDRRDSYALTGSSKTGALAIRIPLPDLRGKLQ